MKTKILIASTVLLGASVAVAPVQASHDHDELWPLYGLTGLLLLNSYSSHHKHNKHHYYYDNHYGKRGHYKRRHHSSHGRYKGHRDGSRRYRDSYSYDRRRRHD